MLKLLERNIETAGHRLVLLAPPQASIEPLFTRVHVDPFRRRRMIREVQRLRGGVYLRDGAISRDQLSGDGLHQTPEDERSWHFLITDGVGRVSACVWYMVHGNTTTIDSLRVRNCPLAQQERWHSVLRLAVEGELARARRDRLNYAEIGGWAAAEDCRRKSEGLMLALAAYSFGRISGGALGMTTATVRHSSSAILRRLGGSHLAVDGIEVPQYYDPRYRCEMELLRFDSRRPDAKYRPLIDRLGLKLAEAVVLADSADTVCRSRAAA